MATPATVVVLTYCRKPEFFYGTELIFRTLRVGFPNARVEVVDNASLPEVVGDVRRLAAAAGAAFESLPAPGVAHHEFIEHRLKAAASVGMKTPLVFVDPDICFWKNCEGFEFDGILAGKRIAPFRCEATQTLTLPRIHTSFQWIPDPTRLFREIEAVKAEHGEFQPFMPYTFRWAGSWCRFDTGGSLYAVLGHRMSAFTEKHLDCYDHIFCGSHVDLILPAMSGEERERLSKIHASARDGNLDALRGIWRWQGTVLADSRMGPGGLRERKDQWMRERVAVC